MRPIDILKLSGGSGGGGGGGSSPSITDQSIFLLGNGTVPITVTYTVGSDGVIYNQDGTALETWLAVGSTSAFQVMAHVASGNTPTGSALDTWLACSSSRSWSLTANPGSSKSCTLTVSIRDASPPNTVRDTATISLDAENFS